MNQPFIMLEDEDRKKNYLTLLMVKALCYYKYNLYLFALLVTGYLLLSIASVKVSNLVADSANSGTEAVPCLPLALV